jgi:hypothetical protein
MRTGVVAIRTVTARGGEGVGSLGRRRIDNDGTVRGSGRVRRATSTTNATTEATTGGNRDERSLHLPRGRYRRTDGGSTQEGRNIRDEERCEVLRNVDDEFFDIARRLIDVDEDDGETCLHRRVQRGGEAPHLLLTPTPYSGAIPPMPISPPSPLSSFPPLCPPDSFDPPFSYCIHRS